MSKNWRTNNPDKVKQYESDNKATLNAMRLNCRKKKYHSDDLFRMSMNIRNSIKKQFKKLSETKSSYTVEIIGCSFDEFKKHIESKWESWMTWENYGKYKNKTKNYGWDLDHIIPICNATTEGELIKLNHYTNFQPLCSYINRNVKRDN